MRHGDGILEHMRCGARGSGVWRRAVGVVGAETWKYTWYPNVVRAKGVIQGRGEEDGRVGSHAVAVIVAALQSLAHQHVQHAVSAHHSIQVGHKGQQQGHTVKDLCVHMCVCGYPSVCPCGYSG